MIVDRRIVRDGVEPAGEIFGRALGVAAGDEGLHDDIVQEIFGRLGVTGVLAQIRKQRPAQFAVEAGDRVARGCRCFGRHR